MAEVFIGSEALAAGTLTRHELQRWHRRIYPDVYLPKACPANTRERTMGATVCGRAGVQCWRAWPRRPYWVPRM